MQPECLKCKKTDWKYERKDKYVRPVCKGCGFVDWSLAPLSSPLRKQSTIFDKKI